ncbi:MAG: DUF4097 family beta strand repeat-containing protein [Candidatus Dormibacteria bacterium]
MAAWSIESSRRVEFEEPLTELEVRLVAGDVVIGATDGPSVLEVSRVVGPAVEVELVDGRLLVRQRREGMGFSTFGERVSASLALSVPADCQVDVETVSASVLTEGLSSRALLVTVSGGLILERLSGPVEARTVSGAITARGEAAEFRGKTVSGSITLDGYLGSAARIESVSGELVADFERAAPDGQVRADTVSGAVLLRLPDGASQEVMVKSVSGRLSSAFAELRSKHRPGSRVLKGTLGAGQGRLEVRSVSGAVSLLREGAA